MRDFPALTTYNAFSDSTSVCIGTQSVPSKVGNTHPDTLNGYSPRWKNKARHWIQSVSGLELIKPLFWSFVTY